MFNQDTLSEPGSDCVEDGDATGDGLEIVGECEHIFSIFLKL